MYMCACVCVHEFMTVYVDACVGVIFVQTYTCFCTSQCCAFLCSCLCVCVRACVCVCVCASQACNTCLVLRFPDARSKEKMNPTPLSPFQVVVPEGKETDRYLNLFKGKLIIHNPAVRGLPGAHVVIWCHVVSCVCSTPNTSIPFRWRAQIIYSVSLALLLCECVYER